MKSLFLRCRNFIWYTWRGIILRPVLSIVIVLVVLFIVASILIKWSDNSGYGAAIIKAFPSFLGDLGGIDDPNVFVDICKVIGLLSSISFIVIITAKITSSLFEFVKRGGSMVNKVKYSGHIIICGWNFQGEQIVKDLLGAKTGDLCRIVILAESEERPLKEERIDFVKGDPAKDEDLIRAGIEKASDVIVLTDFTRDPNTADARAIMIAFAVEALNRNVHSCVQIMNSANSSHLKHAHVDEIICLDKVGGSLAVFSALHHGVSFVLTELLTFNEGSEIYRYHRELSDKILGKEYFEVAQYLAGFRMILLGLETENSEQLKSKARKDVLYCLPDTNRVIIVNPQSEYFIRQDDALFIAAQSEPVNI
jgi:voltage-gated potassium channel